LLAVTAMPRPRRGGQAVGEIVDLKSLLPLTRGGAHAGAVVQPHRI